MTPLLPPSYDLLPLAMGRGHVTSCLCKGMAQI